MPINEKIFCNPDKKNNDSSKEKKNIICEYDSVVVPNTNEPKIKLSGINKTISFIASIPTALRIHFILTREMGIPSYYKFLCDRNPKIIQKDYTKNGKVVLCLDFNCIVYYCLHKMAPYNGDVGPYEAKLIEEVCKYVTHIYKSSGAHEVYIAVDGVVPMAKMKQQRLRRFKSVIMEELEIQQGVRPRDQPVWDRNSITPGTLFMKKLDRALSEMCMRHNWTLNGFNGHGEGEHKVMSHIRSLPVGTTCLVYGLDADLILLSMLNSENKILYLMREEMEFNKVVSDAFLYLSINDLKNSYFENPSEKTVTDYIMMRSLLGNDFLPHSLSLTIKEGGHTLLFNLLKQFHSEGKYLVCDGKIVWSCLQAFIKEFMKDETYNIHDVCKKKSETRFFRMNKQTASEYDLKMAAVYVTPCKWFVESAFWESEKGLVAGWQEIYYKQFLHKEKALAEYCKGLQWILDYYLGKPVEFDWYYPWMYVPLWEDLYNYLHVDPIISFTYNPWIEAEQQLALVLPVKSYDLVQNPKYKKFPLLYPQYFPTQFGFHSLGKKWFYECESAIPIFTSKFLRKILA